MTTQSGIPSFIGASVQRREDPALITGTARYVVDIMTTTPTNPLGGADIQIPATPEQIWRISRSS